VTALLLEPHHDDAVLFACYTMLREHPTLVTVFGHATAQERHGISAATRDHENVEAMKLLQPADWRTWDHPDILSESTREATHEAIVADMLRLNTVLHPKVVYAPMMEENGHEQHNAVAWAAEVVFGERVVSYATYSRGGRRTQTPNEVIPEPEWPAIKLKAMACYTSQINLANCQPWFAADEMLREWIA
jgi:LmbE family N-acetylglucosaminyl deacetylase